MATQSSDVGTLFKSFGSDGGKFRELARVADAGEAQQRWPLLKSMAPATRESPPAMSSMQKNELWSASQTPTPRLREPEVARRPAGLGGKLAKGLQQMSARGPAATLPVQPLAHPEAETPRQAAARVTAPSPASRPAGKGRGFLTRSATAPVFAPKSRPPERTRDRPAFERPADPLPVRPASKRSRLFAQSEPAPVQRKPEPLASTGGSLASTFRRLAGDAEPVAKARPSRPSFLKRLGRG